MGDIVILDYVKAMTLLKAGFPWTTVSSLPLELVTVLYELETAAAEEERRTLNKLEAMR